MIQRSHLSPLPAQPFIQRHVGRRLIVAMSLLGSLAVYACGTPADPVGATIDLPTGPVVATIDLPTSLSLWTSPAELAVSAHVYASPGGRELSLVLYLPQYSEDVLVATVRDGAGQVLVAPTLTWTSSDVSVVTVTVSSSSGHVSATGVGSATITASADGATSNAVTVTVSEGGGPLPAIMYVHGGGFTVPGGDVDQFAVTARHMSAKGFVGATIEYRLAPEFRFPAPVEDSKAAVRWLRANATTYSIDPDRIGAAGMSSGGYLALMVGTTSHLAEFEGDGGNPGFSSRVQAVAAFAGRSDLVEQHGNNIENFLGATFAENPDLYALASPITHVGGGSPPFLLLHGTDDATVPYQQSVNMVNRLMAAGVSAELFTAQGASHLDIDPNSSSSWSDRTLRAMEEFFVRILK